MLDWILDRNDVSKYTIQNVPTDKVFKFSLETRKLEAESKPKKAEPVKNKHNNYQSRQSQVHQTSMGFGHLALAYSSAQDTKKETEKSTKSVGQLTANIETYCSGETITWKLLNWEPRDGSTKLQGETTDGYRTPVTIFLDNNIWKPAEVDNLTDAEWLTGQVMTISQKQGLVQLYLKNCGIEQTWTTANHKRISKGMLEEAGGACYSCGTVMDTKQDVEESVVSMNQRGEILFITCGQCCSGHPYHYGHC
jgi:hypothetical protein